MALVTPYPCFSVVVVVVVVDVVDVVDVSKAEDVRHKVKLHREGGTLRDDCFQGFSGESVTLVSRKEFYRRVLC